MQERCAPALRSCFNITTPTLIPKTEIIVIRLSYIALSLALALGFTACSDDDYNETGIGNDFKVSRSQVALAATNPHTVTVRAASAPTVTSDSEWLHASAPAHNGAGIYTFDILADAMPGYDPRTGILTVSASNGSSTISVTQYGEETVQILSTQPGTTLDPTGGTVTIRYAATGEVDITTPIWLDAVVSKSYDESTLTYTYNANYSETRSGDVVISLKNDPSVSASVTLTQDATEGVMTSDAKTIASRMFAGINIGNTMECPASNGVWGEGQWTTAKVNEAYIKGLKTMGFNAVRIPCAWDSYVTDAANNTIDPAWLDRVAEVVGWVINEDMYAIVNIHWDGGWLENNVASGYNDDINQKQHDYWTQIANRLNKFDEHLLFAGMNEPGMGGGFTTTTVQAIMKYQQTFVDAVRATGGNNATRCLIHQGPETNIDKTVDASLKYALPDDPVANRTLVEIHNYDPSNYTLLEEDNAWGANMPIKLYWGSKFHLSGSNRNCDWGEEDYLDAQYKKMQDAFVSKGIPVIVGEYSSMIRNPANFPEMDVDRYKQSRAYWNEYQTMSAKNHGCVPFYWETGGDINRNNGSVLNQYAIDGIMAGAAAGIYPF